MGNCPRCRGMIFPDNGTREASCFSCGARLYGGRPAHTPTMEERALAEFDQLPYCQQVAYFKAQKRLKRSKLKMATGRIGQID